MFLKGHKAPDTLSATSNMTEVVTGSQLLLMVVPTPYVESTLKPVAELFTPSQILVSCTKVS